MSVGKNITITDSSKSTVLSENVFSGHPVQFYSSERERKVLYAADYFNVLKLKLAILACAWFNSFSTGTFYLNGYFLS